MLKTIFKILLVFIIGAIGGIFADQIIWSYFGPQRPVYLTERKEITIQENTALKEAVEKVEKVVVGVKTKTKTGKILEGSGLIVSSDGLMVTLADLLPWGSAFSFFIDGKTVPYQILKRDLKENLVLVKLGETNLPTVGFANLEKIKLGERVFLVGVIFKEGLPKKSVNEGIIKTFDKDFIETNISERKEFKGSPLFNIEGKVLGLNTIDKEGTIIVIPISKIKRFTGF